MASGSKTVGGLPEEPFTIHALNNYTHMGLSNLADHFELRPGPLQAIIRSAHHDLVLELTAALVPRPRRHEVAFLFDSTQIENGLYGYSLAEQWIPP